MTPLWRRVVHDYRLPTAVVSVALLANAFAFIAVVRPLVAKSVGSAGRAAAAAATRQAAERELAAAQALVDGKSEADRELSDFYDKVLPADLTAARRMTYASLPALAKRTNVRYETRTTSVGEAEGDSTLGHMAIRMVLQGDYRDIRRFIYELETAPEFVIIDNVTLTESQSDEPQRLSISLSTYYHVQNGR